MCIIVVYCALHLPVGKIQVGILLSQLNDRIVDMTLTESNYAFWPNRGTVDMIFTARHTQKKSYEKQHASFRSS